MKNLALMLVLGIAERAHDYATLVRSLAGLVADAASASVDKAGP